MNTLAVPFAYDSSGRLIRPDQGVPGESYQCPSPSCQAEVRWRKPHTRQGSQVRSHFFHLADPANWCEFHHEGESEVHCEAKINLSEAVNAGKEILLTRECHHCGRSFQQRLTPSKQITSASCEQTLHTNNKTYRIDVALLDSKGKVKVAVEVFHRHAVGKDKAEDLSSSGIAAWVEVLAEDFLRNDRLIVTQGGPKKSQCPRCRLTAKHQGVRSWISRREDRVRCPLAPTVVGVPPLTTCTICDFFLGVEPDGVFCFGFQE